MKGHHYWVAVLAVMAVQVFTVYESYYLGTDDWLLVSMGRESVDLSSLFSRQTVGTPAIRPVSILVAKAEGAVFGDAVSPRLILNVLFHGATSGLIAFALLGLGASLNLAGLTALLFVSYPLHAEVLAWYHSGHTTLPMALLAMASITAFARQWHIAWTLTFFILALFTRENTIMVVPVVLGISWFRTHRLKAALFQSLPVISVAVVWVSFRIWQIASALTADSTAYFSASDSPLIAVGYVFFNLLVPVHPGVPGPWIWLSIATLSVVTLLIVQRKHIGIALLWVAIWSLLLVPLYRTDDPLFSVHSSAYDPRWYYLYIPSMAIAWLAAKALHRRPRTALAVVVMMIALQVSNAMWWVQLGKAAQDSRNSIETLLKKDRPIVMELEPITALDEIMEHQIVDVARIFPGNVTIVYRHLKSDDRYLRAGTDAFGYPQWIEVPNVSLIPADALRVRWDTEKRVFVSSE